MDKIAHNINFYNSKRKSTDDYFMDFSWFCIKAMTNQLYETIYRFSYQYSLSLKLQ
jgi:hypothetical protein